jgi:hypothetical protein
VGSYWSDAPSHSLATLGFINSDGLSATNERHIAGSTSRGFNIGSDLNLGENTRLNATAIYDSIDYATKLSTYSLDRSGFGAALTLEQLLTERMKLSLKAENRPLIDSYGAQLQWLPESMPFSVALMSQRLVSNDRSPDSNVFGVNIGFALDNAAIQKPGSKTTTMSDIRTWVQQPAVRMERVQVRSEQRTTVAGSSVAALSVTSGSTAGGTTTTITGTNFTGATAVTFGGVAATAFTVVSNTTITATAPVRSSTGAVDVVVTTPQGTTTLAGGYTYNAAVIFVSATTSNGNLGGLAGADTICNADGNKPGGFASGYTYKAMLVGNNATRTGAGYYRSDGTTLVAVANSGNLVGAASLLVPVVGGANFAWTGAGGASTCSNWTSGAGGNFGSVGQTNVADSAYWLAGADNCTIANRLYCVSQ